MNTKLLLPTARGMKSIPLSALTASILADWFGGVDQTNNVGLYYSRIPWLYRGVTAIADSAAGIPFAVHRGGEDGTELDPREFRERVLDVDLRELLKCASGDLTLYGACYVVVYRNRYGVAKQAESLLAAKMAIQYGQDGQPDVFRYHIGSRLLVFTRQGDGSYVLMEPGADPAQLLYLWLPNFVSNQGPGVSPAQAALKAAGVLANMDTYTESFFANGAVNPMVLTVENIGESDKERVQSWVNRNLAGVRNAFRTLVARGGAPAVTKLGYSISELSAPELTATKQYEIATALGVPQTLLFSNAANYATARQDDLHFYDKTVLPLARVIVDYINEELIQLAGCQWMLHPERLSVFQENEGERSDAVLKLYAAGLIGLTEARERLNLPPEIPNDLKPAPVPVTLGNQPPKPAEMPHPTVMPAEADAEADDLKRWERMAVRRYEEGKPARALRFDSDSVTPALVAAVKGQLEGARTVDEVRDVFRQARNWREYP